MIVLIFSKQNYILIFAIQPLSFKVSLVFRTYDKVPPNVSSKFLSLKAGKEF